MVENLETNRTRIIRGSKETFNLKETKAKRERKKKKLGRKQETIQGIKKVIRIYYPQRTKTLDCNHNTAKCYEKGTTGK